MVVGGLVSTLKKTEELHRRTGSFYKHSITAENSTTSDTSYIKEGFSLQIRFVEAGLWGGKKSGEGTEEGK